MTRGGRVGLELGVLGALAALVLSGSFRCPLHAVTGIPCPGCGLTRATWALARGEPGAAFALHPLVVPVLAWFAVVAALGARSLARGGTLVQGFDVPVARRAGYVLAGAAFVLWIARFFGACGGPVW